MKKHHKRYLGAACAAAVVGAGNSEAASLVFREGLSGYTGTQDTWFSHRGNGESSGFPENNFIRTGQWGTPPDFSDGANQQSLLRFDGIFGANSGQVPGGSSITSATLRLTIPSDITYADGEANAVHQMLVDWVETDAYNAAAWSGGVSQGVDRDGAEAMATPLEDSTSYATDGVIPRGTTIDFDVTSAVQAWSANPASNYGFLLESLGLSAGNGLYMASSEYAGADGFEARPTLIVEGDFPGNVIDATVNRNTRQITITNTTGIDVENVLGYVIRSSSGALDQTGWLTVADNYDVSGNGMVDDNDNWSVVTHALSHTDLSEFEFDGGDGGILPNGDPINLGPVWIQNPDEDLTMVIVQVDGTELNVELGFTGNSDAPFDPGDLNFDGSITATDWPIFRDNHLAILTGMSPAEAYQFGDLDGDLDNDEIDFELFKAAYDDANGAGAFVAMVHAVPEPPAVLPWFASALVFAGAWRRQRVG